MTDPEAAGRPEPPHPEPQQDRSRATRRKLLDAAVDVLVEDGLAAATTAGVSRRAGMSQGALFKHFPTKNRLLGAAAEHLFEGLVAELRDSFGEPLGEGSPAPGGPSEEAVAAVRALDRAFRAPRLGAGLELMVAARSDPGLREAVGPAAAAFRDGLRREAAALFPGAPTQGPANADLEAFVDVVVAAMVGRAVARFVQPQPRGAVGELVALNRLAASACERREGDGSPPR